MTWVGSWRNQYGSVVEITSEADGRIAGTFRTALKDSQLYGQEVPIVGVCQGDLISFVTGGSGAHGRSVVSYTGALSEGRMETLWHLAASERLTADAEGVPARKEPLPWWRAITTSADTFERTAE